jgi:hypothetical protein
MFITHPTRSRLSLTMAELSSDTQQITLSKGDEVRTVAGRGQEGAWYVEAHKAGQLVWQDLRYDGNAVAAELVELARSGWLCRDPAGVVFEAEWGQR